MTNREAIEKLQFEIMGAELALDGSINLLDSARDSLKEYINAIKLAIAAMEKQEPMKPRLNYKPPKVSKKLLGDESTYTCTHCGNVCLKRCSTTRNETFYCWNCGQKLDWTEGAE